MPLAAAALVWFTWTAREQLFSLARETDPFFFVCGIGLWLIFHFMTPLFTILVLRNFGYAIPYTVAFRIHAGRLPTKYLPGGVWHSLARASDYHTRGLTGLHIAAYFLLENLAAATTTLAVGGLAVASSSTIVMTWRLLGALAALASGTAIILLPSLLRSKRYSSGLVRHIQYYYQGLCVNMLSWLVAGSAFYAYLSAFPGLHLSSPPPTIGGIYIFSWAIGFLTIFAPQGMGVTELVAAKLLITNSPLETLVSVVLGFRLLILCADMCAWLISLTIGVLSKLWTPTDRHYTP